MRRLFFARHAVTLEEPVHDVDRRSVANRFGESGRQLRQRQIRLRLDPPQDQRLVRVDAMGPVVAALLLRQTVAILAYLRNPADRG